MDENRECLYCAHRGVIRRNNRTSCANPHPKVESTQNAHFLGYWDYPKDYAWQFKVTRCPNYTVRRYE